MDERSLGLTLVRPTLADRRFAWEGMTAPGIVESMMGPPRFPEQPVPDFDQFCADWEPHFWTHEDPRLGRIFLIVADGERVGLIAHNDVVVTAAGEIATELDLWLVSADRRGRGYGPAALDRMCEMLPDLGVELAFLQPTARNPASIRAAEKAGFERVAMPPEEAARFHRTRCDYADSVFLSRRLRESARYDEEMESRHRGTGSP